MSTAENAITNENSRRFCSNCMKMQPTEGGILKKTPSAPRWRCAACTQRVKDHMEKSKK